MKDVLKSAIRHHAFGRDTRFPGKGILRSLQVPDGEGRPVGPVGLQLQTLLKLNHKNDEVRESRWRLEEARPNER